MSGTKIEVNGVSNQGADEVVVITHKVRTGIKGGPMAACGVKGTPACVTSNNGKTNYGRGR